MSLPRRGPGRPLGEISTALLKAASQPGTARELAQRAQVGFDVARYKVKDLQRLGHMVALGDERPRVLVAAADGPAAAGCDDPFVMLERSFWVRGPDDFPLLIF